MTRIRLKHCLYPLLLVAYPCSACERTSIGDSKADVERAFVSKSFSYMANRYAGSQRVELILEDDYNDENPTTTLKFRNLAELSKWFFEKHEFSEAMIIPPTTACHAGGCTYSLPELTLHHGTYLVGFQTGTVRGCTALTRLRIHWG